MKGYFKKREIFLWAISVVLIVGAFLIFDRKNYLNMIASLIGVTSLILNAKGNYIGQILIIIFSIMYGIISYSFRYWGEMITYLCMTMPMAIVALVQWIKNPMEKGKLLVKVNSISKKEILFMSLLSAIVTIAFYFILKAFNTANLLFSTISVLTSFAAVYLTFRRSSFFAFWYALNDIVLIILWTLASVEDISYISVIICFAVFLVNDIYGFICWQKMKKLQK